MNRSRTTGCARDLRVRRERAEPQAAVVERLDAAELVEAVDRDEAVRQRRLALTRADDEVGAAGDRAGAGRHRRDGLVDGGRR